MSRPARTRLARDARLVLGGQAVRAFGYGLGVVLLGRTLAALHLDGTRAGLVLAATVAGTAVGSVVVARYADRLGRRRCYGALYGLLAVTGVIFAFATTWWLLAAGGLLGAVSSEVIESGPFTSLEQAMLADALAGRRTVHGFGLYNAIAAASGSAGALAGAPADQRWFLLFVALGLAGVLIAHRLSGVVDTVASMRPSAGPRRTGLSRSRPTVSRLAGLFALDSFAGGITVSAFVAYWLTTRFGAPSTVVAVTFAAVGVLQAGSFLAAPRIADRIGLLPTMVATHLVSNALLAAIAFAPTLPAAVALLLARTSLSNMDVPTRQAYVMALVDPTERTAAAAWTGTVRYLTRPAGPPIAGLTAAVWLGLPFLLSGALKAGYDVTLWAWFRRVPLPEPRSAEEAP